MCPPANPSLLSEIGLYWSDEQIIALLEGYTSESHLPSNVLADSNPYDYPPSNLPEGIWYLVHPNDKKESDYGFWIAKSEACKIYSNSKITGWRTTLEYFEGHAPHGQRTDWLMQEYSVTRKGLCDKDMLQGSRLLCRVFPCSGHSSKSEMQPQNCQADTKFKMILTGPNINIKSSQESRSESQTTRTCEVGAVTEPADKKLNPSPPLLSEEECFLTGDYITLDDLEDHSNSSSSQNSSCPSNLSDKYFDSLALLQEIEEDKNKLNQNRHSSSGYNFTTSVRPNDVVFQPASPDMPRIIELIESPQQGSPIPEDSSTKGKCVQDHITKRHILDSGTEGSLTPSTTRKGAMPSGRKKPRSNKIKKLKLYFCLTPF